MRALPEYHKYPVVTIRVGPADYKYGRPYSHHLSLIMSDPPEIIGLENTPSRALWLAVKKLLQEMGVERVLIVRFNGGRERRKILSVR